MKQIKFILLLISIVSFNITEAQVKEPMLHYLIRDAKIKQSKPPVIILLHGYGSNEQDLFAFANQLPDSFLVISAQAPNKLGNDSYAWYPLDFSTGKLAYKKEEAEKSRLQILQFIIQLESKHQFDAKRVYVCGFSQGGILAYGLGLTNPDKIKGIAVLSGRLLEEIKLLVKSNENLKSMKIFVSHGTNDKVIDVSYARDAHIYLQQLKLKPSYHEYPVGHTISNDMFNDLINWLKK